MRKFSELPQKAGLSSSEIDNCFFVQDINTNRMDAVKMSDVFNWIKEKAETSGLTVEQKGDKIIFISK